MPRVSLKRGAAGVLLAPIAMVAACGAGEPVVQPLPFDHAAHVKGKVDCLQCHEGVLDPAASRLPALETCTTCHTEEPAGNTKKEELRRLGEAGEPLVWDPALRLADDVVFSHARHVDVAGFECAECHADMPERTEPPAERRTVSMDACIACHEEHQDRPRAQRAIYDCAACHR